MKRNETLQYAIPAAILAIASGLIAMGETAETISVPEMREQNRAAIPEPIRIPGKGFATKL